MDPEALRRNAQQSQRGAEQEQRRISGSAVDPDYVQRLEHFGGLSHEQIYAAVQAMNPGDMHTAAETWVDIADNLCGDIHGLIITVQGALADGLAGRIADAADIAARQFAGQAMDVAEILHSTGHRMAAAAYGAEALRKTVPPPPVPLQGDQSDPTATYLALILGAAPGDAHSFEAAREEQYRLALAALEANYIPIYPPAGSGVPAFSPVEMPGANGDDPAGSAPGSSASLGTSPAFVSPVRPHLAPSEPIGYGSTDGSATSPAAATTTAPEPAPAQSVPSATHSDTASYSPSRDREITTKPASVDDAGRPLSPLTPVPTGTPSVPGSPGSTPAPRAPGRSLPGPATPGTPSTPSLSSPPPRTANPTMGWMPGMYPPAARPTTDSDAAHPTPAWLIRNREQELLGTPPSAIPAVLGADIPCARTDLTTEDDPT